MSGNDEDYDYDDGSSRSSYDRRNDRGSSRAGSHQRNESSSNSKDAGSALQEQMCVTDDGKLRFFGKEYDVGGKEVAFFLGPAIDTAMAAVAAKGASVVGKGAMKAAEFVKVPEHNAAKVGKGFYYLWLFGLSGASVALDIKKTVKDGLKDIHDLREQAQPLLAANNDKDTGLGNALTSRNPVLAHARAKIYADFRHNLYGTLATAIRVLPMVAIGYNQAKLDDIAHPERVRQLKTRENMSPTQRQALSEEIHDLKKRQIPQDVWKEVEKKQATLSEEYVRPALAKDAAEEAKHERELLGRFRLKGRNEWELEQQKDWVEHLKESRQLAPEARNTHADKKAEEGLARLRTKAEREYRAQLKELARTKIKHRDALKGSVTPASSEGHGNHDVVNMFNWFSDPDFKRRMFAPFSKTNNNYGIDYKNNIRNLMVMPAAARMMGDIVDHKLSREAPDSAWDKIMDLQRALERHPHDPDRYKVISKVEDIFKQYAHDLGMRYHLDGASLSTTSEAIADALINEKLHPQAMAEILDNKKIVEFGKNDADFGDIHEVKSQLKQLVAKYNSKVGEKEIYRNAPFTKESLKATFREIPEDEKPFFTMLFPPGVLEHAGVEKAEVQKYRDEGKDQFVDALTDMMRVLYGMGRPELKKQGIHSKQIDALQSLEEGFRGADKEGDASKFVHENMQDVVKTVRNIAASAKKPGEMWKEYVARKDAPAHEDMTPKTPVDHATRESGDEIHVG